MKTTLLQHIRASQRLYKAISEETKITKNNKRSGSNHFILFVIMHVGEVSRLKQTQAFIKQSRRMEMLEWYFDGTGHKRTPESSILAIKTCYMHVTLKVTLYTQPNCLEKLKTLKKHVWALGIN